MVETLTRPEITQPVPEPDERPPEKRLLTREEYHKMADLGIFGPDERLELINGEVYKKMSPQTSGHFSTIEALADSLRFGFGDGFSVRQQGPAISGPRNEPEPDVSVFPGRREDFRKSHPRLADAALVVEVSDTTLRSDRTLKASVYAEAGVREYWIVNLKARCIEAYRRPCPTPNKGFPFGYEHRKIYDESDTLSPLAAPDAVIAVADILPPE